jgi:hypothetical protein
MATQAQEGSLLFRLPQEIRQEIYARVFEKVDLKFNDGVMDPLRDPLSAAERNSLALLRTCRQICEEIGDRWLNLVCFSFAWPDRMLDVLTPLLTEKLAMIRHIRVRDVPMLLHDPRDEDDEEREYRLVSILKLLPGLRLDTLMVMATSDGPTQYRTLDELVQYGNGWKELHFLTTTSGSEMLGYSAAIDNNAQYQAFIATGTFSEPPIKRQAQPSNWETVMKGRDGASSEASVTIWRSTLNNCPGSAVDKATSTIFRQTAPTDPVFRIMFGAVEDEFLMQDSERGKDMLVIVKRDAGADYEEKWASPFLERDMRHDFLGMKWEEIRDFMDTFSDMEDMYGHGGDELYEYVLDDQDGNEVGDTSAAELISLMRHLGHGFSSGPR